MHGNPVKSNTSQREAINKVKNCIVIHLLKWMFYDYFIKRQIKRWQKFIDNQEKLIRKTNCSQVQVNISSVSAVHLQMCVIHNMSAI